MKSKLWRKKYLLARELCVDLIKKNLISAYPDREHWECEISALEIFNEVINKKCPKKNRANP